jgi:hypothetical protein
MSKFVRAGGLVAVAAACACSPPLPGVFVGESEHFRLYVSAAAEVPPGFEGDKALTALEVNWADTATLLPLTTGKIEYRWVAVGELASACTADVGGCEFEGPIAVSYQLPDQHELNHAYMELMTKTHANPVTLVTEGYAEAIGCGQGSGARLTDATSWQELVALPEPAPEFVSEGPIEGATLVRYLIRSWGGDRFVAYYAQATKVRDPALFADNFQRFWGISLDAAWSAMKTADLGVSPYDNAICPCSLASLPLDQPLPNDPTTTPYWTIPEGTGKTLALEGAPSYVVHDFDCLGQRFDGGGGAGASLVRLGAGVRGYVLAPLTTAMTGNFVSDTCPDAEPFSVPGGALSSLGLDVQVDRSTAASDVVYLQLQAPPGATTLSVPSGMTVSTCGTCAFGTPTCPPGNTISPTGTTYVQLSLALSFGSSAQVTSQVLRFQ